jgi:hypothetical protein
VVAMIVAGALQRWWAAAHAIGTLTSDGALIGLMSSSLLHHGQLTAYQWGQSYGGSLEQVATAAVFAVTGTGTRQLLATTALSSALAALALWRAGRHVVGERAAQLAALTFWVWPASAIWRSVKPSGTYMIGLALALCAVGALARIRQAERGEVASGTAWYWWGLAGIWSGLAVWSSPMSVELLIPAALWLIPTCRRRGRLLVTDLMAFGVGACVGGLPAIVFGATHDWTNLHMPGYRADLLTGIPSRFRQFFPIEAPIAMGVRLEGSLAWVGGYFGEILAWAGAAGLLVVAGAVLAGRASRCALPVLSLMLLPFLYALIPLADHAGQGRYAMFAVPMAALLIGVGLENARVGGVRPWLVWVAGLALACALGTGGLLSEPGQELVAFPAPDVAMPVDDSALLTLLAAHRVQDAYAPYWMAYRVAFETDGRTQVTPYNNVRDPSMATAVANSPHPAYLFVTASRTVGSFEGWCRDHGIGYQAWQLGGFTVVQPTVQANEPKVSEPDVSGLLSSLLPVKRGAQ